MSGSQALASNRAKFGTHSLRRTKAVLIYRRTGNLRAVQLLLGHTKIESTVRYLGIEVDDAIEIAEKIDTSNRRRNTPTSGRGRRPLPRRRPRIGSGPLLYMSADPRICCRDRTQ